MSDSADVENTMSHPEIHDGWVKNYRTSSNEAFFRLAFARILDSLAAPRGAGLLDAGCGTCRHAVRLHRQGFSVQAVDFSDYAIARALDSLRDQGLDSEIPVSKENLLDFSFSDESFDYILCWGVLMHIPDIETAVSELSRILKSGGVLILSEVNMHSWEVRLTQLLRPLLGKTGVTTRTTPAGIEAWAETDQGPLMSRRANIPWLLEEFSHRGLSLRERRAGQFTEAYMRVGKGLPGRLIHGFNNWYFEQLGWPGPACGNILLLEKDRP